MGNLKFDESDHGINLYPWQWNPVSNIINNGQPIHCTVEDIEYHTPNKQLKWMISTLEKTVNMFNYAVVTLKLIKVKNEYMGSDDKDEVIEEGFFKVIWILNPDSYHFIMLTSSFESVEADKVYQSLESDNTEMC